VFAARTCGGLGGAGIAGYVLESLYEPHVPEVGSLMSSLTLG
jgi:hypothetical protein